ncbi:MAG: glycosyltransferase [Egibacteraceae bacterium]
MRIVQLANFVSEVSGGIRTALDALGRGYGDRGVERILVVPGPRDAVSQRPEGVRIEIGSPRVPSAGGYRIVTRLHEVRRVVDRLAPDALEVSDRLTLARIGPWASQRGTRTLVFAHERLDATLAHRLPALIRSRPTADRWNHWLAEAFDTVVCASAFTIEEFTRVRASNAVQVPLGVDLDRFSPDRRSLGLRRRLAAPEEVLLIHCSRLSSEKRPAHALAAVRALVKRGVHARLYVAGDGPLRRDLEVAAAALPVTFLGHVNDRGQLAALFATADAMLAPSPAETFGLAVLEALACGTPVVCADTGALPELLAPGAGVATAGYGHAYAAGVLGVLEWDLASRRAAARRRAECFPWQKTVEAMLALHRAKTGARRP